MTVSKTPHTTAYLFDVDGVITDLSTKQVTDSRLLEVLSEMLCAGNPLAFNTGRSIDWVVQRVVAKFPQKTNLQNLFIIGEFGGTWATFDSLHKIHTFLDEKIKMPISLAEEVRQIVQAHFRKTMFYDESKKTMISIEMQDGLDIKEFQKEQISLMNNLKSLIHESGLDYIIHQDLIATNIRSSSMGKHIGADRFLHFLADKHLDGYEFEAFGDILSDFAMADTLHKLGKSVKMVFVGEGNALAGFSAEYPIFCVPGFAHGTLSYLLNEQ